ncbi:MAG: GNAT family N-acetyltransferase [Alphaproteobacteria bacterium]
MSSEIYLRTNIKKTDAEDIANIIAKTGVFIDEDVLLAKEVADETIEKGSEAGYGFVFAEVDGKVVGYSCYGDIPTTENRYDLYWIAVLPEFQKQHIGSKILKYTEEIIASINGKHIYIETSSTSKFEKTRKFYIKNNYTEAVVLDDFFRDGDGKVIYVKKF